MTLPAGDQQRYIVPRWHTSALAAARAELAPLRLRDQPLADAEGLMEEKLDAWRRNRSLSFAADLVGAALLFQEVPAEALAAAGFILTSPSATPSARMLARRVVDPRSADESEADPAILVGSKERSARIRDLRHGLREGPRNPLAWADLSFEYASAGLRDKSVSAMEMALRLAPTSRFVVRSAPRLFLQAEEPDRAVQLLRHTETSRFDPWVMAAEIAASGVARRSPRLAKVGATLIVEKRLPAGHVTELSSALATLEAQAGDLRRARRFFNLSLIDPTENAVAQAESAAREINGMQLEARHLELPGSYEARARQQLQVGKFGDALKNSWLWLADQPFASDPASFGSYVAGVALRDYAESLRLIEVALVANPSNWLLLNNQAFALASLDRLDEAEKTFDKIVVTRGERGKYPVWRATRGLLQFRRGRTANGREDYLEALRLFQIGGFRQAAAIAAAFLAREELLAGGDAKKAVDRAAKLAKTARLREAD